MHPIQEKLLHLSKERNLAQVSLREMAAAIGMPAESPQKIKHHLQQLEKKGFFTIDRSHGLMEKAKLLPGLVSGLLTEASSLFSIPIVGTANCGPATLYAEQNFEGFLRVSGRLLGRSSPAGLYAIKTNGSSMNRAEIGGKKIEDGDYVVIDSGRREPANNDIVLAIIDNKATIKRFIDDRANGQVILKADSSYDYEPIYLHPDDDFLINGKAVAVIKH
ncbi:MAG: S24 family peptidase [Elusimicrobiales bacterium]|nr:S24 family peptidase [Elusimicrobiales bacterium]